MFHKKRGGRILIVDDEPNILHLVSKFLRCQGYDVITAASGEEGLEKAINEKPDVILLDVNMPIINGYQMLNYIRNNPELKDIPVIMLTAFSEAEDVNTAVSYDITDYITKPFDFVYLCEKITQALQSGRKHKARK